MQIILLLFAGVLVLNYLPVYTEGREAGADRCFLRWCYCVFDKTWKGSAISYIGRDELGHVVRPFWRRFASRRKNWSGDGGMTTLTQCQQQVLDMLISTSKNVAFRQPIRRWQPCWDTFGECSGGASSRTGEKRRHHIKRGVARGITLHTAVKDDDRRRSGLSAHCLPVRKTAGCVRPLVT